MRRTFVAVIAALATAGCGGAPRAVEAGTPTQQTTPPSSEVSIYGDASAPVNKIAIKAIADLQQYWSEQFPQLYGSQYRPVEGGFYAVRPTEDDAPPCAQDADEVAGNAFYCATKDVIAWDAEGLLPDLQSKFGPASHAYFTAKRKLTVQHRMGNLTEKEIRASAEGHELEETIVGLSILCALPPDVVERALTSPSRELALFLTLPATIAFIIAGEPIVADLAARLAAASA